MMLTSATSTEHKGEAVKCSGWERKLVSFRVMPLLLESAREYNAWWEEYETLGLIVFNSTTELVRPFTDCVTYQTDEVCIVSSLLLLGQMVSLL